MADAPWRCSQCGTVNEPVANSCRTCGRWPSLFELQDSAVAVAVAEEEGELEPLAEPEDSDLLTQELDAFELEDSDIPDDSLEPEPARARRRRLLPLAVAVAALLVYVVERSL